jgi:SagB-type dehydrogenase family enzyme
MSTIPLDRAHALAMLFHLNSEPWMNAQAYDEPSPPPPIFSIETAERVPLPPATESPTFELIRSRYSCREFSGDALAAADVATLLQHSYGFTGLREVAGVRLHHRPVPSAGALFPLELYLLVENVTGIPNGAYHYAAWHHRLERVAGKVSIATLLPSLQEQQYLVGANLLLFITAVFPRTMTKYGPRGYRYILLEAGHVAQNICLLATELGLATLCLGGFRESAINEMLQLQARKEGAVYAVAIGRASGASRAPDHG